MTNDSHNSLQKHPFVEEILKMAVKISMEHRKEIKSKSDFYEYEYYCLQLGSCLAHLLTVIQQMEHAVYYMSNFTSTEAMKKVGINRSTHLIWSVENYIIRTRTVYDRSLILVDRLFHIQNQGNQITHESIITNAHISRTNIRNALKPIKSAVNKYYFKRNQIIHEASYADNEIASIELFAAALSDPDNDEAYKKRLKKEFQFHLSIFLKDRKQMFSRINKKVCIAMANLFDEMHPIYKKKYSELFNK